MLRTGGSRQAYQTLCSLVSTAQLVLKTIRESGMEKEKLDELLTCSPFHDIHSLLAPDVERVMSLIISTIYVGGEVEKDNNSPLVRSEINEALDTARNEQERFDVTLTEAAKEIMEMVVESEKEREIYKQYPSHHMEQQQKKIKSVSVVFIPHIGYLAAIPQQSGMALPPFFEVRFASNSFQYCSCPTTRRLDDTLGDVAERVKALETKVERVLADELFSVDGGVSVASSLLSLSLALGNVDALVSMASACHEFGWKTRPLVLLGSEGERDDREVLIRLDEFGHPLIEPNVPELQPLSISVGVCDIPAWHCNRRVVLLFWA